MDALTGLTLDDATARLTGLGCEPWRARAILAWVYRRGAESFEAMTDLSAPLRARLAERLAVRTTAVTERRAGDDGTTKFLLRLRDGDVIEAVLIPEGERRTVCLSTQVGCPIRCVFCASGMNGLARNLEAAEIVEQVLHARRAVEGPISNIVIMGIGEPLLNFDALSTALQILHAPWGLNFGYHRITLSTVGILKRLEQLREAKITPNLALSLHAPNDRIRRQVVPMLPNVRVADIVEAGRVYALATRKQVTCEYVLLGGVNDEPAHAAELARLLRGSRLKVNLLPWNRVAELPCREPSPQRTAAFAASLKRAGVQVTVRKRKGDEVSAACGQLRASWRRSVPPSIIEESRNAGVS